MNKKEKPCFGYFGNHPEECRFCRVQKTCKLLKEKRVELRQKCQ